jgi:hypothetical protein
MWGIQIIGGAVKAASWTVIGVSLKTACDYYEIIIYYQLPTKLIAYYFYYWHHSPLQLG